MLKGFALGLILITTIFTVTYFLSANFTPEPWKRFYNSYISFSIPSDWKCESENTEWVCRIGEEGPTEAIIILTAKVAGPQDTLEAYKAHLETPRTHVDYEGEQSMSQVVLVERRNISEVNWIVGVHNNSEVNDFQTSYFATVHKTIGILITFTSHQDLKEKYELIANEVVRSLVIVL